MGTYVSHDRHQCGSLRPEATPSTSLPPGDRSSAVPGALHVQAMVAEFHQVYGCATDVPLKLAGDALVDLRINLIQEELAEVMAAMRGGDPLCVAQELADLAYVTAGCAVALGLTLHEHANRTPRSLVADSGAVCIAIALRTSALADDLSRLMATIYQYARFYEIDLDAAVAEVHRANLSKLDVGGLPIIRADGKILKGSNFTPPDLRCAVFTFAVPASSHDHPPWWLDGIEGRC